jgi:haloalkane dehalogenase
VVVPDQIGFGLSEKPHDHGVHTLDNHTANIVALLDRLDLRAATFVCHDWAVRQASALWPPDPIGLPR